MNTHISYLGHRTIWFQHRHRIFWLSLGAGQGFALWNRGFALGRVAGAVLNR